MNIKNLIFIAFPLLVISGCGQGKGENTNITWSITTGAETTNIINSNTSGENLTWISQLTENLKINPKLTNEIESYFPVTTCSKIVELYSCIISKAPLENQPVMQKALTESIKTWHLMPDTQLRKVCENIINQEEFIRVKEHYTGSGQNLGCTF